MLKSTIIYLPDSVSPGSPEAVKAFTEAITRLKEQYPKASFQFLPFSYNKLPGHNDLHLISVMAISF